MRLAVDAMGGDYAPKEIIDGVLRALAQPNLLSKVYLVGDADRLTPLLPQPIDARISLVHTDEMFEMGEHPAQVFRQKKNASVSLACSLVKNGDADAIISAGSTGAQLVASLFNIGRIKGVQRPAIVAPLPNMAGTTTLLVDAGANAEVDANHLAQFAAMGAVYKRVLDPTAETVRVGLVSNGTEPTKGTELVQEAWAKLEAGSGYTFAGNIEGAHVIDGSVDVAVTDGFTGNVILKTLEGFGKGIFVMLKEVATSSIRSTVGAALLKPALYSIKDRMDAKKTGGAPLLGINGVSIVCHGNSDAEAIYNGILVAQQCVNYNMVGSIEQAINNQ